MFSLQNKIRESGYAENHTKNIEREHQRANTTNNVFVGTSIQ